MLPVLLAILFVSTLAESVTVQVRNEFSDALAFKSANLEKGSAYTHWNWLISLSLGDSSTQRNRCCQHLQYRVEGLWCHRRSRTRHLQ